MEYRAVDTTALEPQ